MFTWVRERERESERERLNRTYGLPDRRRLQNNGNDKRKEGGVVVFIKDSTV